MWLFLEAVDVWMFRDGKPFNAGEGHIANTLFPPSAATVQGALRTFLLDQQGVDMRAYVQGKAGADIYALLGNPRDSENLMGQLTLYGPFLALQHGDGTIERYVPIPQDLTASKEADLRFRTAPLRTLRPNEAGETMALPPLLMLTLDIDAKDVPLTGYWLAEGQFAEYLAGESLYLGDCVEEAKLFSREYRSGNALDYQRRHVRADEGMLYSASFIRPRPGVGLLVWVSEPIDGLLPEQGILRFGGEGRVTCFRKVGASEQVKPETPFTYPWRDDARLKVVLLTSAYFEEGWLPSDSLVYSALVSAALTHPVSIGGWDMAQRRPRPIRRYVPAGSVYYLEFQDAARPDGFQLCEQPAPLIVDGIMINELPLVQLGFGHVAIGIW